MTITSGEQLLGITERKGAVRNTPEFQRIMRLPRRPCASETITVDVDGWTRSLALRPGVALRPVQAQALAEIYQYRGGFLPVSVGEGKTLITATAPVVLGARRPLLVTLANLQDKTRSEFERYSRDWRIGQGISIRSYEGLGRPNGAQTLELLRPDLIVFDEAHRLKNRKAAVTRRVSRYLQENPETLVVALTGTIAKAGICDFAHVLVWCLKLGAPVPIPHGEAIEWGEALDDNVQEGSRRPPGVLAYLASPPVDELGHVRRGFRRRLTETPGVVASKPTELACTLIVQECPIVPGPRAQEAFAQLRVNGFAPDGYAFTEAIEMWACARQLAMGFAYVYDPRPPQWWLDARKAWAQFVRGVLERSRSLDSEATVRQAVIEGKFPQALETLRVWIDAQARFKPTQKTIWLDDAMLKFSMHWLDHWKGIVWTEHTAFAERLSEMAKVPFFGLGGKDRDGNAIDTFAGGPCIASIRANSAGRNLQDRWSRGFVPSPPTNSKDWQQLIGRFHRPGQTADLVQFDIASACSEHVYAMARSFQGAVMQRDLVGEKHKLHLADYVPATARRDAGLPSMAIQGDVSEELLSRALQSERDA